MSSIQIHEINLLIKGGQFKINGHFQNDEGFKTLGI